VNLEQGDHPKLRPNQKVKLMVIKHQKNQVARIQNGDAIGSSGKQKLFVINNGKAVKKEVNLGMISSEYVEVKEGIAVGDCVIVSGIPAFSNLREIEIVDHH
jgi:HlyD family secretion protein